MKQYRTGFVLGKFCPLHKGHKYLIDTAITIVEHLYVVVDNIMDDVIPVTKRMQWVKAEYPDCTVLTQPHPLPQDPSETTDFWNIWRDTLLAILPEPIDVVFASEDYGYRLAEELGAVFNCVDLERKTVPICASGIRSDLLKTWNFLSDAAKRDLRKTICIFGPESTGKSTLTQQLASYFDVPFVKEYAEDVIRENDGRIEFEDMEKIVIGHHHNILKALDNLPSLLFVDTDAIASKIWSNELFGKESPVIENYIAKQNFDHYLLLDIDMPWQDDVHRFRPTTRELFFQKCENELITRGKRYSIIRGIGESRFQAAVNCIYSLLES